MKRYILDSGIAGDYMNRRHGVYERAKAEQKRGNKIGMGTPILAEMIAGLEKSVSRDRNMQRLHNNLPSLTLWPFDEAAAFEYGRLEALLHRIGRPMQTFDIELAAIAFTLGNCVVVTVDSDLSAVPGLEVENWRVLPPGG